MHDVGDVQQQAATERTGRMRAGEVVGGEAARLQQGDRERIAHRQRRGGAGGGGERQRAGFGGDAHVEVDVGLARQGGTGAAGHRQHRVALALERRQQQQQFVALARVGQGQHHIGVGDHAEVAMGGLAGMHVERRGAGRGQGRRDLARDMAGLAHAGAHHAAAAGQDRPAGGGEVAINASGHGRQRLALDREHAAPAGGEIEGIRLGGRGW